MVVAEAMSYGVPVLCYRNEGPGELVPPASQLTVPYGSFPAEHPRLRRPAHAAVHPAGPAGGRGCPGPPPRGRPPHLEPPRRAAALHLRQRTCLMSHIIAVHLLNDRSGSPLVLRHALAALHQAGHRLDLLTATPGPAGHLSHLPGVRTHALPYRWSASAWRTLLRFGWAQLVVFWKVLWLAHPGATVYVNSLLPFGAALAGRCRGARVVYHVHEVSIRPALLRRLLCAVVNRTAHEALFVSEYVRQRAGATGGQAAGHLQCPESGLCAPGRPGGPGRPLLSPCSWPARSRTTRACLSSTPWPPPCPRCASSWY